MTGASGQDLLGGRYRLLERRGSGGMAEVWWARDEVLERDVAVKVLAPQLLPDRRSRERMRAEAQAVARLNHPNIAAVHDYGESGAAPYLVMELLDGITLAQHLADQQAEHPGEPQALPWRDAVTICAEVAAALAAAHSRGVVHRDIKPANVMLTSTGSKVVDFGIAGIAGALEPVDALGRVLGTPEYLAPERLLGEAVVPASDVYALGLLLYRCLTGDLPWHANTPTEMLVNHCHEPPQPLPDLHGLPDAVNAVYDACLSKDPATRPDAAMVARLLADAAGVHVAVPGVLDMRMLPMRPYAMDATDATDAVDAPGRNDTTVGGTPRRALVRAGLLALGVAGVVGGTAFGATHWLQRDRPAVAADQPIVAADLAVGCRVRYELRRDVTGSFGGTLTVTNTGDQAFRGWTVRFDFTGAERLKTGLGGTWQQEGQAVSLHSDATLAAGQAATVAFTAQGPTLAMPTVFLVDQTLCAAETGDLTGQPVPTPVVSTPSGRVIFNPGHSEPTPANPAGPTQGASEPGPEPAPIATTTVPSEPTKSASYTPKTPDPSRTKKSATASPKGKG